MDIPKRIESVRKVLHLNHGEMAKDLGLSRSMYYYVKGGEREIGTKAMRRLEQLEASATSFQIAQKQSELRIHESAEEANQYGTDQEKQLAFEARLAAKQTDALRDQVLDQKEKVRRAKKELRKMRDNITEIIKTLEE